MRSVFGAGRGPILAKGYIAHVMDVFDPPVTAARPLDLSRAQSSRWAAGHEDLGFFGDPNRFEMVGGADDHGGLGGIREARILRSDFEGINLPGFMPAVSLVQSDVRREKKRPPRPGRAGRAFGRAWVDWL